MIYTIAGAAFSKSTTALSGSTMKISSNRRYYLQHSKGYLQLLLAKVDEECKFLHVLNMRIRLKLTLLVDRR